MPRKWKEGGTHPEGKDGWVRFGDWKVGEDGESLVEVVIPGQDGIEDGDSKVALTAGVTPKRIPDSGMLGMLG